ncbi:MoaD/ThiS family protein [Rothia nasimurium]|uniref:MoaD/ThiS family protein n=1 Tax=Rothia nasimurium TaxID=85336 RepID=UPI001F3993B4|nr:MoaD/ThiS family protein [Rothia nasimurium]
MQINFFAAARAAAGLPGVTVELEQLPTPTLAGLQAYLAREFTGTTPSGQTLADILPRCTFLVDGVAASADSLDDAKLLQGAQRLDVLPPFAGG